MRIFVKAKPGSKKEFIKKTGAENFTVAVKEVAEKGKANKAIIKALAEFLNIPTSSISFVSGEKSRQKVLEVPSLPGQLKLLDIDAG